jgi:hypothetical protein
MTMKRREFVERLGVGSIGIVAAAAAVSGTRTNKSKGHHQHEQVDGPLANAIVTFGAWMTTPALDRFPNNSPRTANLHLVLPYNAKVKAGGSVSFNISGVHQILIYGEGTTLETITRNIIEAVPPVPGGPPPFPGFIDDSVNRIYRGLDPRPLPQDRVESVSFANPGTYLVVCGLVPHFDERMHGWVKVV